MIVGGLCPLYEEGVPPGKDQEYVLIVPPVIVVLSVKFAVLHPSV